MKNTEVVNMEYGIEWCEWTGGRQNKQKKRKKKKGKKTENLKNVIRWLILHDYICIKWKEKQPLDDEQGKAKNTMVTYISVGISWCNYINERKGKKWQNYSYLQTKYDYPSEETQEEKLKPHSKK